MRTARVLILSFSRIATDPRVMRQVRILEDRHQVTVAGFGAKPDAAVDFIELHKPHTSIPAKLWWALKLLAGRFENYYWNLPHVQDGLAKLSAHQFDTVIANDASALPLALRVSGGRPVLLDAHEYSPREFDDRFLWRLLFRRYYQSLCERYLPRVAAATTVCQGIADEYHANFGIRPIVVHNAPFEESVTPSPVAANRIRMVHHGNAIRSRRLESMIELMGYVDDRFTLDFMLVGTDRSYLSELQRAARKDARIRFIEPVPMQSLCSKLNQYDVGLYLLPPVNFNHLHALPNKFFEFIQARLAVVIGPSPEMAALVRQFSCGVVAASFAPADVAAVLNRLDNADVQRYKQASDTAARALSYERAADRFVAEVDRLAS